MIRIDKKPEQINSSQDYDGELKDVWESSAEADSLLWSIKDDKLDRKHDKRNRIIEKIRDKFLSEIKERSHGYEYKGNYLYKSPEHYKQFIAKVESEGLTLEPENTQLEGVYDFLEGYYHNIPLPKAKISAKPWIEINPFEIERLGGMELEGLVK